MSNDNLTTATDTKYTLYTLQLAIFCVTCI